MRNFITKSLKRSRRDRYVSKKPLQGLHQTITGFTHVDCHATCEAYKAFRAEMDRVHKAIEEGRAIEGYVTHACEKNKRRHR